MSINDFLLNNQHVVKLFKESDSVLIEEHFMKQNVTGCKDEGYMSGRPPDLVLRLSDGMMFVHKSVLIVGSQYFR